MDLIIPFYKLSGVQEIPVEMEWWEGGVQVNGKKEECLERVEVCMNCCFEHKPAEE